MPAKYIVVPHRKPDDPNAPTLYYPRLKSSGEVSLRELANEIAQDSTISQADTIAVMEALLQHIPRHLAEGKIVRLGELGSFHLSIQGEGVADAGAVNASKIKKNRLRFRAGKLMKDMLANIVYLKD